MAKKISGEAEPGELLELERIFRSQPEWEYVYAVISKLQGPSEKDLGLTEGDVQSSMNENLIRFESKLPAVEGEILLKKERNKLRRVELAAVSVLLCIVLTGSYFIFHKGVKPAAQIFATGAGEEVFRAESRESIVLQDGTQVWLNKGSTLTCQEGYGRTDREVSLSGEAFFEVYHDAVRPFIVHAGRFMEVKVLGTSFNIKAYPDDPFEEASVITGEIAVNIFRNKPKSIILKGDEKITIRIKDSVFSKKVLQKGLSDDLVGYRIGALVPNPENQHISETSWINGELAFNDMPFSELAYDLERIYHVKIIFRDEQVQNYHLTGVFKGEDLPEVLNALQITTPFHYNISDKLVTIF